MDIFSHALWGALPYRYLNIKRKREKFNLWVAAFWGIFPDLFAFAIPFAYVLAGILLGKIPLGQFPHPASVEPLSTTLNAIFHLTANLYHFSHSLIIFFAVVGLIYWCTRKIYWPMGAWLLHILIDIPSHSYAFYPTPIFWPLSSWKFNGISWATPWFMIANYSALAIVYFLVYLRQKKRI